MKKEKNLILLVVVLFTTLLTLQSSFSVNQRVFSIPSARLMEDPPADDEDEGFFILRHKFSGKSMLLSFHTNKQDEQRFASLLARYQE